MAPKTLSLLTIALAAGAVSASSLASDNTLGKRSTLAARQTCSTEGWIPACPGVFACIPPGGICCDDGISYAMPPETCPEGTLPITTADTVLPEPSSISTSSSEIVIIEPSSSSSEEVVIPSSSSSVEDSISSSTIIIIPTISPGPIIPSSNGTVTVPSPTGPSETLVPTGAAANLGPVGGWSLGLMAVVVPLLGLIPGGAVMVWV